MQIEEVTTPAVQIAEEKLQEDKGFIFVQVP
jgi:hypothetical protein